MKDDYIETVLNDWKWRHHHFTYFHPDKRSESRNSLEIKSWPGKEPTFNELWERKRISNLTNYPSIIWEEKIYFYFLLPWCYGMVGHDYGGYWIFIKW